MALTFAATPATHPGRVAGSRSRKGKNLRRNFTGWMFVAPATIVVIGLSIFPAVWAFFISRAKWNGIAPATQVGWQNYQRLATDPDMLAATRHTLLLTVLFVPSSVVLGIVIAIALNQRIRLIGFYRTCIFVPYVASAAATGILASFVFNPQFGVINDALRHVGISQQQFLESPSQALYTVVIIALWGEVGFTTVIYLAALQDIPRDLVEAATMDGANKWRVFRHITLPALRPVTVFATVWQTITAMQLFDLIFTTTRGGPLNSTQTIVYYIYELAFQTQRLGYGAAAAYLLFIVTLLLTLLVIWYSRRRGSEVF
jgi:multiple sugar transport system permease protein